MIERSKGFEFALLCSHGNLEGLGKYQASKEHHWYVSYLFEMSVVYVLTKFNVDRVMSTYMFPYREDLVQFDFEVAPEDECICNFLPLEDINGAK